MSGGGFLTLDDFYDDPDLFPGYDDVPGLPPIDPDAMTGGTVPIPPGTQFRDTVTGRTVTFADIQRTDPAGAAEIMRTASGSSGGGGQAITPGGVNSTTNAGGFDLRTAAQYGVPLATGALGLALTLGAMAGPDGRVRLPDGRTIQLSPQEQHLLDIISNQARGQSAITDITNPIVADAVRRSGGRLGEAVSTGIGMARDQVAGAAGTRAELTRQLDRFGRPLVSGDLAAEQALTEVAGQGATNLNAMLREDRLAPNRAPATDAVGSAADAQILEMMDREGQWEMPDLYGSEEGIRSATNARLLASIEGRDEANPQLVRQREEELRALENTLSREVGPGWRTSSPGIEAMRVFNQRWNETMQTDRRNLMTSLNAVALPRSEFTERVYQGDERNRLANLGELAPIALGRMGFAEGTRQQRFNQAAAAAGYAGRGRRAAFDVYDVTQRGAPTSSGMMGTALGADPTRIASAGLGSLASIGNQQAAIDAHGQQFNVGLDAQDRAGRMGAGGALVGAAASPFFSAWADSLFDTDINRRRSLFNADFNRRGSSFAGASR